MSGALKEKRRLCPAALEKLQLQAAYRLLGFLQAPFAFGFWRIEQAKARIEDRIENERSET